MYLILYLIFCSQLSQPFTMTQYITRSTLVNVPIAIVIQVHGHH